MQELLVVFDIDGTLVDSYPLEDQLYTASIERVLGLSEVDQDWRSYGCSTDSGLLLEISKRYLGRPPSAQETAEIRRVFVNAWTEALRQREHRLPSIPGALELLDSLRTQHDVETAFATGAWRATALIKLGAIGVEPEERRLSTSDDAVRRPDILRHAIGPEESTRPTVYVGDGLWDIEAAHELEIGFLGVARGERADAMAKKGAQAVVPDLRHTERVQQTLRELACHPARP